MQARHRALKKKMFLKSLTATKQQLKKNQMLSKKNMDLERMVATLKETIEELQSNQVDSQLEYRKKLQDLSQMLDCQKEYRGQLQERVEDLEEERDHLIDRVKALKNDYKRLEDEKELMRKKIDIFYQDHFE